MSRARLTAASSKPAPGSSPMGSEPRKALLVAALASKPSGSRTARRPSTGRSTIGRRVGSVGKVNAHVVSGALTRPSAGALESSVARLRPTARTAPCWNVIRGEQRFRMACRPAAEDASQVTSPSASRLTRPLSTDTRRSPAPPTSTVRPVRSRSGSVESSGSRASAPQAPGAVGHGCAPTTTGLGDTGAVADGLPGGSPVGWDGVLLQCDHAEHHRDDGHRG